MLTAIAALFVVLATLALLALVADGFAVDTRDGFADDRR